MGKTKLEVGDRVEHADPRLELGSGVISIIDEMIVRVDWDNETWGLYPWDRKVPINAYGLLKLKKGTKV